MDVSTVLNYWVYNGVVKEKHSYSYIDFGMTSGELIMSVIDVQQEDCSS